MLVCVVGNFGDKDALSDGQGIKTLELYNSLVKHYGPEKVCKVNLYSKRKIMLAIRLIFSMIRCKNLIVLVSKNGRKTVIPLLVCFNKVFHRKIYHSLIGSTTHETLQENKKYVKYFNSLAGNWSETTTEMELLKACGLTNVRVVKNFKNLRVLEEDELAFQNEEPFRFCTFMRVEEKKGIPNVVRAIKEVNMLHGQTVCTLDIYGHVMEHYAASFEELQREFGDAIQYKGVADFDKSVDILKNYFMLVFPTRYYTEGIPGTILDAYSAGLPVICAEWESCYDIITKEVGITYAFDNDDELVKAIQYAIAHPEEMNQKKKNCLFEARKYSSDEIVKTIAMYLER